MEPQPPTPTPQVTAAKPARSKRRLLLPIILVIIVLALGVAIAGLVMQRQNTNKLTAQAADFNKRITALEQAASYENTQVDKSLFQAVFLTNGQVYFGNVTTINKDTLVLQHIFYLKAGSIDKNGNVIGNGDISLVKLGDELHAPKDTMYIERKNVQFWENLKPSGQVAKAITDYKLQNPSKF